MKYVYVVTIDETGEVAFDDKKKILPWVVQYCAKNKYDIGMEELESLLEFDECQCEDDGSYIDISIATLELL